MKKNQSKSKSKVEEREINEVTRGFVKTGTEKMIYTRRMTEKLTDLVRGHMNVNYS